MSVAATVTPDALFVNELLRQATLAERISKLQAAGLLNQAGLLRLLTVGTTLVRSDPGQARQVAELCLALAADLETAVVMPPATYLKAQVHAIKGELNQALPLIAEAHQGYLALGENIPALRTYLGRIHVLNELGRHQEAIAAGKILLSQLNQAIDPITNDPQIHFITMMAHNNLGVCYRRMGRYEDALQAYEAAEAKCIQAGFAQHLGDIRNNPGVTLVALGRISEALGAFEAAADSWAEAGLTLLHAESLSNIGEANLFLGKYMQSLEALSKAQFLLKNVEASAEEFIVQLHRGHVYLSLNLYPEALAAYQTADSGFETAGMTHYRARALWGMGIALTAQGQFEEAEHMLTEAAAHFERAENIPRLCSVMLEQVSLQDARGQAEAALTTAQQALALVDGSKWLVEQLYAHLRLADLWLGQHQDTEAETHLLAAQALADSLVLPQLRYRLYQRMGHLRLRQGQPAEARQWLESAVTEIEQLRGNLAQEAMRASFLYDKIAAYDDLLALHLQQHDNEAAFGVAEQAKSRALVDLLTGVVEAQPVMFHEATIAQQYADLQADLNAAYNEFLGSTNMQERQATRSELGQRVHELEQAIRQLHLQAASTVKPVDSLAQALPLTTIRSQLPAGLTLLAYHIIGDEIIAFVHTARTLQIVRELGTVTAVQRLLQKMVMQWDRFRAGREFVQRHPVQLERSAQRILQGLFNILFAPFVDLLPVSPDRKQPLPLAIVPHGILHQVPFHALFDGERYLVDTFEISYAPSTTVLALCQQRPFRTSPPRSLLIGVTDPLIPHVTTEINCVARELEQATIYFDDTATKARFQQEAGGYDILHLACHGLFRADSPMFSALRLGDNWLTAVDVMQLDFTGALVTLSACESGRSEVMVGDEVIGLSRAFLGAGAATLVVSLWLVQDDTTATLMTDWYRHWQQGKSRAAALRAAQLALKADFPHPYYWAPFILVGQR